MTPQSVASGPVVITTKTICTTRDVRNGIHSFKDLINCTVIEGNLKILLIDHATSDDFTQFHFPDLVEITDYMLLYRVYSLKTLRHMFPNLAVIRGHDLFFNFALVAFEMVDLEELGLVSLTVIERGAVRLEKNRNLCYVTTIDWSIIATGVKPEDNFIQDNKNPEDCVNICPDHCPLKDQNGKSPAIRTCWTSEDCQKRLVPNCPACAGRSGRYCYNHGGRDLCCHQSCLGGCYGETRSDCIACKNLIVTGNYGDSRSMCRPDCDPGTFMYKKRRCLMRQDCIKMKMKVIEAGHGPMAGRCVKTCPFGYMEDTTDPRRCILCEKECPKECQAVRIDSINEAQKLKGCTIVTGPLEIGILKGSNVGKELEENLGQIKEVLGHIWIHSSHALLSLNFFKSLEKIHGKNLYNGFSLLVNDNLNLQKLFPEEVENRLKILSGNMFFHFNRKLCLSKIKELEKKVEMNLSKANNDISDSTNGDQMPCYVTQLNLTILSVSSTVAFLKWENFKIPDNRKLLSYVIYYKEAPTKDVSIYDGRDACSENVWQTKDVLNNSEKPEFFITIIVNLHPWTQYAVYVQTYTTASATYGAMSKLLYFRTAPAMPTSPANLVVRSVRQNELLVTWDPPTSPHGNVTHYEVYWRKRELVPLKYSRRNYCTDPLRRLDLDTENEIKIKKEQKKRNETEDGEQCCACPRSEEEKASERLEREIQIKFENYLQNIIYTKREPRYSYKLKRSSITNGTRTDRKDVKPGQTRPVKLRTTNNTKPGGRRRRRKRNAMPPPINEHEKAKYTPNPDAVDVNETEVNQTRKAEAPYFKSVVTTRELVLPNLGHFEDYNVEVIACLERDPRDPRKVKLCSNRAITMGRSLPKKEADSIDVASIKILQNTSKSSDVLITWDEPPNPNGLIITYHLEYSNVNTPDHQKPLVCIPRTNYTRFKGHKLTDLSPANYTFRIMATSLAGKGEWTSYKHFDIEPRKDEPWEKETIIAVTVSIVLLVLLLTVIVVWFCARHRFSKIPDIVLNTSANPEYWSYQDAYEADEWEVDRDKVRLLKELGQGSFGMVYKGLLFEDEKKEETDVAVKTVNESASFPERTSFLKEASIMKGFKCFHVVQLLGVVSKGQPAYVIMELMSNGDLKNFLRLHRPDEEDNDGRMPPTLKRIMQMAGEIADGMAYLADKKFVHRDLAARNCMVAEDLTVKLGDFGMTRDIYETDYYRKGGKGLLPVRWMGPESLKDGIFTSMSDVWSYGVVLWEMATLAAQPYQGLSNEEVLKYVLNGKIMERPDGCPQRLFDLMMKCWQFKPRQRPTFKEIIEMLVPDLDPEFREKSYFFSEENRQDYGVDDLDLEDEDVIHDQDDSQMPFINGAEGSGLCEASRGSFGIEEELDMVNSDYKLNNFPHARFSAEPCDCVMLQETNMNADDQNHRHSSCSYNNSNSAIGSSDGSKDSSKSSNSSYAHMNGINPHVANGHIPLHMRMTSC
nr:insulin-like growth factor 1 receptor [Anadara broughtonii]